MALPAAGVALVWIAASERRTRWVDLTLLALVSIGGAAATGGSGVSSVLAGLVVVEILLALFLLHRWVPGIWGSGGDRMMNELGEFGHFLLAMVLAAFATALLRAALLVTLSGGTEWGLVLRHTGRNAASLIAVGTFGLLLGGWLAERRTGRAAEPDALPPARFWWQIFGIALATTLVLGIGFTIRPETPTTFMLALIVVWAALATGPVAVAGYCLLSGAATVVLTVLGHGPIAQVPGPQLRALVAQLFVIVLMVIGMTIALTRRRLVTTIRTLARSEAEVSARFEELDMVIEHLDEGVAIVEEDGGLIHSNGTMRRILKDTRQPRTPGSGRRVASYRLHHLDGPALAEDELPHVRALRGESVTGEEYVLFQGEPDSMVVQVSAFPVRQPEGSPPRAMVVLRDVTTETQARESLASFASTVAHDLNNPLMVVDGWAEAIQEELADQGEVSAAVVGPMVEHVRTGVETVRTFVDDLLAHAVARDQTLRCDRVSLESLVKRIAATRDHPGRPSPVTAGHLDEVWADGVLVQQVLDNLIGNALKYAVPDVDARVHVESVVQPDGWVCVRVLDNGIGVPEDQREMVFRSFHRVDRSASRGTGLGLSIVKRIVQRHGGTIEVRDNPGGPGSSFEFTLPGSEAVFRRATAERGADDPYPTPDPRR